MFAPSHAAPRAGAPRVAARRSVAARLPGYLSARSCRDAVRRLTAAVLLLSVAAAPPLVAALGTVAALVPRVTAADGAALDIDTADAETLAATLPGIGPVKAKRIVEHRERHGPFDTLESLLEVKGIGPATLARIRSYLEGNPGGDARSGTPPPGFAIEGVAARAVSRPLSTSELERATRAVVRRVVLAAERDAAPYR